MLKFVDGHGIEGEAGKGEPEMPTSGKDRKRPRDATRRVPIQASAQKPSPKTTWNIGGRRALIPLALALFVGMLATVRFVATRSARAEKASLNSNAGVAADNTKRSVSPFAYPPPPDPERVANTARAPSGVAVVPKPDPQALARAIVADARQPGQARVRALNAVVNGKGAADFEAVAWTLQNDRTFAPRYLLVKGLGDLGDTRAAPLLIAGLQADSDVESRRIAARALEPYIKVEGVEDALQQAATSDGDRFVRENVVRTLSVLPSTNARGHLEELLRTERDAGVRTLIENTLASLDVR